jgi:hypothetical protein
MMVGLSQDRPGEVLVLLESGWLFNSLIAQNGRRKAEEQIRPVP